MEAIRAGRSGCELHNAGSAIRDCGCSQGVEDERVESVAGGLIPRQNTDTKTKDGPEFIAQLQ
jgi:hypothetical protein